MVDCSQFLEEYSAFRDGALEDDARTEFEAHLAACPSCARYDRVITEGVRLYRKCPEITASDDFLPRLQHRLYHVEEEMRGPGRSGSGAPAALMLAIAATMATIAWIPAFRQQSALIELPAVAARAPLPPPEPPRAFRSSPQLSPEALNPGAWGMVTEPWRSNDLLFQASPAGPEFGVHSVSQH
jgi:hypothetical protein